MIHNSKKEKREATEMSIKRWMNKQYCIFKQLILILISNRKEWIICKNLGEYGKHYAVLKNQDSKPYSFINTYKALKQAQLICNNWKNNASYMYAEIIDLLIK